MKRKLFLFLIIGLAFSLLSLQPVQAAKVVFELDYLFSDSPPPADDPPWAQATFDDFDGAVDFVELRMLALNLADDEFIGQWYFNFSESIKATDLFFSIEPIATESDAIIDDLGVEQNFYKAGGDGYFDLLFDFQKSNNDTGRFTNGDEVVVHFNLAGLEAEDFNFLSSPTKGIGDEISTNGTFYSAAHIQAIGPGDESGWVAPNPNPNPNPVPEAPTMLLVGMGLIALAGFGRMRFKT